MRKINDIQKSYIAGFLDGDGSVYIRLKKNETYKYGYQVAPYVILYQKETYIDFLKNIRDLLGIGYIRSRKDGVSEYIIGDEKSLIDFSREIAPFSKLKKQQLRLLSSVIKLKSKTKNAKDFIALCQKIDRFKELNYSKKRTQDSKEVSKYLISKNLLTP